MTLKGDPKFKGKLTCGLKNDIGNLRVVVSLEICTLMGSFCQKHIKKFRWKGKERKVMSHDTEEWCKVWRETDFWFQKWHEKFGDF